MRWYRTEYETFRWCWNQYILTPIKFINSWGHNNIMVYALVMPLFHNHSLQWRNDSIMMRGPTILSFIGFQRVFYLIHIFLEIFFFLKCISKWKINFFKLKFLKNWIFSLLMYCNKNLLPSNWLCHKEILFKEMCYSYNHSYTTNLFLSITLCIDI